MEPQMSSPIRLFGIAAVSICALLAFAQSAKADPGDKTGWSVNVDPRKRAFLYYVLSENDPRILTIGCLRDVDSFTIVSNGLKTGVNSGTPATLSLSNGKAQYDVDGNVETDQATGTQTFDIDIDADAVDLRKIAARLLPVFEGNGPIILRVGAAELALSTSGLAQPLSRFKMICLGNR
jgi:hypothetical protein